MQSYQYYPVIIQIGARFIRVGFAGDATPILRTPTNAYDLSDSQLNNNIEFKHALPEKDHIQKQDGLENNYLWTYDLTEFNAAKLECLLERIIYDIYQRNLLVDAKKCKVLVLEPPLFPIPLKKIIAKVFLFHIHAQSLRFYPEPVLSCVSAGSSSGLVIDLGWNQTTVTPIFDLRMMYKDIKVSCKAGRQLHEYVRDKLQEFESWAEVDSFSMTEKLICDTFYCRTKASLRTDAKEFEFENIIIPNSIRYELLERFMFEPEDSDLDNENHQLVPMITTTLRNLPIDLRSELSTKIIITGGLSNMPGLKTRILEEVEQSLGHPVEAIDSLGSWEGASLYCSTSLMSPSTTGSKKSDELFRDRYLNGESVVTDWTDQLYTQQRAL